MGLVKLEQMCASCESVDEAKNTVAGTGPAHVERILYSSADLGLQSGVKRSDERRSRCWK